MSYDKCYQLSKGLFCTINLYDMETLPIYVYVVFVAAIMFAVYFFSKASKSKLLLIFMLTWMAFTGVLAWYGFFENTSLLPPRFLVAVLPPLLLLVTLNSTRKGIEWLIKFDLHLITKIQVFRLFMELTLYWLFLHKLAPELMTFEGRNFDIIPALTSIFIYYLAFKRGKSNYKLLLYWNVISLFILVFTVINGVLSAPGPFQQFAFEQPNKGILYFPFIWLPAVAVPIAYYCHVISMRIIFFRISLENQKS